MKKFAFRNSLKQAWEIYKKNWEIILVFLAAVTLITMIVPERFFGLTIIVSFFVSIFIAKASLVLNEKKSLEVSDLKFTSVEIIEIIKAVLLLLVISFIAMLVIGIIAGGFFALGLLVNMIFGIGGPVVWDVTLPVMFAITAAAISFAYLNIRMSFLMMHFVKRAGHEKTWDMIKGAWNITRGNFWKIVFFDIKLCILNLIGILALFVGLFVTVPLSWVLTADFYNKLVESHKSHNE